ncbi:hypothetical protein AVEN_248510-1 [Araneus ventricosus]|uniref:Uncharacterized protein n=1 Tax=Araneus ventricosus TaxID=182803 RepID=A0A4Y2E1E2_ARAVE|nr:hypothetical protein AVEN_248510-1 [Araneus ventricosus]
MILYFILWATSRSRVPVDGAAFASDVRVSAAENSERRRRGLRCLSGKVSTSGPEVPGLKPGSTKDQPRMRPVALQIIRNGQTSSRWCDVEVWRGVCTNSGIIHDV